MMNVLIIDDNPATLALAEARLQKENLEVTLAHGGEEGLQQVRAHPPDLILLDLQMPDLSGYEVCERIMADTKLQTIPIIFLTAADSTEDKVRGLDMGAVDYVAKPFDPVELSARVRAALRVKRLQDLLNLRAKLDPLTELWNRSAMEEQLHQEWARVNRHESTIALIMLDVDHFKHINDDYGHPAGDQVLCAISKVLSAQRRESDLSCRYGGEEFAIILPQTQKDDAGHLAERCRKDIEQLRIPIHDQTIHITASFGVADSQGIRSRNELLDRADQALYQAKEGGRNRVVLWRQDSHDAAEDNPAAIPKEA